MTVLPGSLDYLYHNGILDHVPYEVYQMTPMTQSGMLQMSGMGNGLNQAPTMQNYSPLQSPYNMNVSQGMSFSLAGANSPNMAYPQGDTYVQNNNVSGSKFIEKVSNTPTWIKGLLAGGIMLSTLVCMFKTGKKSAKKVVDSAQVKETTLGMWDKIKEWFKRK